MNKIRMKQNTNNDVSMRINSPLCPGPCKFVVNEISDLCLS